MPRRNSDTTQDALELFLDTISNTFGGVVFIALLVAILIQVTEKRQREADPDAARKALQAEVVAATNEVQRLEKILSHLREMAQSSEHSADAQREAELAALEAEQAALDAQLAELTEDHAARRRLLTEREAELAGQEGNNHQRETELEQLKLRLEQASNLDPLKVRLPRFKPVDKRQIAVLVANGRLVFVFTENAEKRYGKLNTHDLEVGPDRKTLRARRNSGLVIEDTDAFRNKLRALLDRFDRNKDFIYMAVWPDSYDAFALLRDTLLEQQWGYGLVIMSRDEAVKLGSGSGAGEQ